MRIAYATTTRGNEFVFSAANQPDWTSAHQLGLSLPTFADVANRLTHIEQLLTTAKPDLEFSAVTLRAPVPMPGKILAIGHNYQAHVDEVGKKNPTEPYVFSKYASSLTGPTSPVQFPQGLSTELDYECELAVVIGRTAKQIPAKEAHRYIVGYTVANDVSTRDLQRSLGQISLSKGMDSFCPMGPWVTTQSDVVDVQNLQIQTRVNGDLRQDSSTDDMIFSVVELLAYITKFLTLHVGDIILTGTPSGVGMGLQPPSFLKSGDVVMCSISELGSITNEVHSAL